MSMEETAPDQPNIIGPDFFSYYAHEVAELLKGDEPLSFFPKATESESAHKVVENGKREDHSCAEPPSSKIIEDSNSEMKKELLKTLLRESVSTLTREVDEMLSPVVDLHNKLSQLRCKKQQLIVEGEFKDKVPESSCKKAHDMSVDVNAFESDLGMQVDEDEDMIVLEQFMEKYAKEYYLTLHHMEKQLEAILETTTSRCRSMTRKEKQELKISIQKLPSKNLDRVAEIIFRNKPSENSSPQDVFVDLENEDNSTLWRLYFYVKAVDNARKLAR